MASKIQDICVDINKIVLSSKCRTYKTENLIKQIKNIANVDFFLSKISEGIIKNLQCFKNLKPVSIFRVNVENKKFIFDFVFGRVAHKKLINEDDIIFCNYKMDKEIIRQNDQRIVHYLKNKKEITFSIEEISESITFNFDKLYVLSNGSNINLPLLSEEQKRIVEIMDQNVVVQGVAGAGKTNVCIDKLIYSVCRNYSGKILYSTYSRGLINNTRLKIENFKHELLDFVSKFNIGQVEFLDSDKKKALENKFGIYFFSNDDNDILEKINRIINYLDNKVDYVLIDDLYKLNIRENIKFVNESYFVNTYLKNLNNHQVSRELKKLDRYSYEILYKEIYGVIFGFYNENNPIDIMTRDEYIEKRKDSFCVQDCTSIYLIASDYKKHLENNNLMDINLASKELISIADKIPKYSLAIIDEVQDYSQVNLNLFNKISLKMFCVGDALQMINPSYFTFGYLKNLLYEEDVVRVAELKNNYRNTKKIEQIISHLSQVNLKLFGTHNFVLNGKATENEIKTETIYVSSKDFVQSIARGKFDNFTIVVSSSKEKDNLRKILKNQEILTVSEIKGLERDTIILLDLLTSNQESWSKLSNITINRKNADENSVYRYYFNLFYVGVSRAKQNLFVVEGEGNKLINEVFNKHFEMLSDTDAIDRLGKIVSKIEYSDDELIYRVKEFLALEQFENALISANKIMDDTLRQLEIKKIEIYKDYISLGLYRDAGIKYWELGLLDDAKQQFILSKDNTLIELLEACENSSKGAGLSFDIVEYYSDVKDNEVARNLILNTLAKDISNLRNSFKNIAGNFTKIKESKYGKQK